MPWQHKGRVPSTAAHPPDTLTYSVEEVFIVTGCRGAKMSSSSLRGTFRARPGVPTAAGSRQQPARSDRSVGLLDAKKDVGVSRGE